MVGMISFVREKFVQNMMRLLSVFAKRLSSMGPIY